MDLTLSINKIKGVGPKTVEQLGAAGIETTEDLLNFFPRSYEDYSHIINIDKIKPGKVTLRAYCEKTSTRIVRRGLRITTATIYDRTGKVQAVWFNQPYRATQLKSNKEFFFSGTFEFSYNRYQLTNPSVELVSDLPIQTDRILPIYKSIKGLKSNVVRKLLSTIRNTVYDLGETLPQDIIKSENLLSKSEAYYRIHFPNDFNDIESARERLAFEELFQLILASQLNKKENHKLKGLKIKFNKDIVLKFLDRLDFKLTDAQRRASWEILQDLDGDYPMNRLLQGDVGSGKTVVAGLVACQVASAGFQTAIMAPTEILAKQHADTLNNLLKPLGYSVGLLTSAVKGIARRNLYNQIKTGSIDIIIGTHALIQGEVKYNNLGFVVIDEQHRFGVDQRQQLLKKARTMPHLLTMTATPIPRSLALTVYGELDISIIDELPKNRLSIITKIWSPNSRAQLYEKIDAEIDLGHQVYVVCSLIEENIDNEVKSVESEYKKLNNSIFKHRKIGLLHGKLKPEEKNKIMKNFSNGVIDILISTTVVEVGVDVPNATVILIEDADRFGLSQLHQLRGRVGRSSHQSYCYLVTSTSAKPSARLRAIEKSNDGFYLAEVDLKLRGPGEIYGRAQHGALNLQIATLADTKLTNRVKKSADSFIKSGESLLKYPQLARQVKYYQKLTTLN